MTASFGLLPEARGFQGKTGLCQTGLSLHAMPDYPIIFRKYLKEIRVRYVYKFAQAHAHTEDEASTADMTAGEFIQQHPKGNYVLCLWWHVTCARDGFLYDTWDASREKLLEAWEIPPDIASAPRPSVPWLYERSERRLAPWEDIDVAAGQTFLFRNPSPVNRGTQDSFVRAHRPRRRQDMGRGFSGSLPPGPRPV